jgi:transcription elongation factor Elf1
MKSTTPTPTLEEVIDDQIPEEISDCPLCGGQRGVIGKLGKIIHIECRNCGMKFTQTEQTN